MHKGRELNCFKLPTARLFGSIVLIVAATLALGQSNGDGSFRSLALSAYSDEPPKCEASLKKLLAIPLPEFRTEAASVGRKGTINKATKRALAFVCAVRGIDESASLKILSYKADSEESSVRMAEVDSICRIFGHRKSNTALAALIRIQTDGESAELQSTLVVHLLRNDASTVLNYLDSHPSDLDRVSDMVVYQLDGEDSETKDLASKLKKLLRSSALTSKSAKKVLKAIQALR